jgi:hypothetical protein
MRKLEEVFHDQLECLPPARQAARGSLSARAEPDFVEGQPPLFEGRRMSQWVETGRVIVPVMPVEVIQRHPAVLRDEASHRRLSG